RALALLTRVEDAVPVEDEASACGCARGDALGGRHEDPAKRGERSLDRGRIGVSGHFRSSPSIDPGRRGGARRARQWRGGTRNPVRTRSGNATMAKVSSPSTTMVMLTWNSGKSIVASLKRISLPIGTGFFV